MNLDKDQPNDNDFLESRKIIKKLGQYKNFGAEERAKARRADSLKAQRQLHRQQLFSKSFSRELPDQPNMMDILSVYEFISMSPTILYRRATRLNCTPLTLIWFLYHQLQSFLTIKNKLSVEYTNTLLTANFNPIKLMHNLNSEEHEYHRQDVAKYLDHLNLNMMKCISSYFPRFVGDVQYTEQSNIVKKYAAQANAYTQSSIDTKISKSKIKLDAMQILAEKIDDDYDYLIRGVLLPEVKIKNILGNYHLFDKKSQTSVLNSIKIYLSQLVSNYATIGVVVDFTEIPNPSSGSGEDQMTMESDIGGHLVNLHLDSTYGEVIDNAFFNNPLSPDTVYYSIANMDSNTYDKYFHQCGSLVHTINYVDDLNQGESVAQCHSHVISK